MDKKYTNEELYWIVQDEGLGYAIQHYLNHESIEDTMLAEKWKQCSKLLTEIDDILEESAPE